MSQGLPAAAAAVEDDDEEILPSLGGRRGLRDQDLPSHDFSRRRHRLLPAAEAAGEEDEEATTAPGWGSGQRDGSIQVSRYHSERSQRPTPCRGLFTVRTHGQEQLYVEHELDSTASTPPSPEAARSYDPVTARTTRTQYQSRKKRFAGVSRGQTKEVDRQANSTSTKSSPVKITRHVQIKRRHGSRASSDVWDHFTPHETEDGPIAVCNYCHQIYRCDRSIHGTSTLGKHVMNLCTLSPFWDPEKRRKTSDQQDKHFNIDDCRKSLAKMVILDEMAFSVVEGEGFKGYSKTLEPRFELPSRITVARDCMKLYLEERTRLKNSMDDHRICLTIDTWTSKQNLNYMSLTGQWVDQDWKLQKRVLNNTQQAPINTEEHDISHILESQFALHLKEIESGEINSELSRFLKENCELNTEKFNILTWWKVNANKYRVLSKLAKDILAVPVSTVASESAFSTNGRVVSSFRSSLSPKMVEALVCAQSWIRSSPRNVDLEEIVRDLKNCEALEEELTEMTCGD